MNTLPKSILVPTDFSESSDHALQFAQHLALDFGAVLQLVHVQVLLEGQEGDEALEMEISRMRERLEEDCRGRVDQLPENFRIHSHLKRGLAVAESILESAQECRADLIVIGTNGRRGLRHLLLGSVAEEILKTAEIPVMTVRRGADIEESSAGSILIPYDFSARSDEALNVGVEWARALSLRITLLHAIEPVVYPELYAVDLMPAEVLGNVEKKARKALEELAGTRMNGIDVSIEIVHDRAVEAILSAAEISRQDFIVMGNRGLSGLEHLLLGSVVEGVARRAEIPVLSVRSGD